MGCGLVNGRTAVDPERAMTPAADILAPADGPATVLSRIHRSFIASVGSEEKARFDANPSQEEQAIHGRLVSAGFSDSEAETVIGIVGKHPGTGVKIAAAVDLGVGEASRQSPLVRSAWMFFTDLFAASVPVIPFALFSLATARIVSLLVTFVLLVLLGVGRAKVGRRRLLPTVAQTVGIAAAAALAGVGVGKLIS